MQGDNFVIDARHQCEKDFLLKVCIKFKSKRNLYMILESGW